MNKFSIIANFSIQFFFSSKTHRQNLKSNNNPRFSLKMATTQASAPLRSDQCVKGINWGQYTLEESKLSVKHNQQSLFSLSLSKLVNTSVLNKNEVVLELPFDEFKDE